jgi:hypothetical protein
MSRATFRVPCEQQARGYPSAAKWPCAIVRHADGYIVGWNETDFQPVLNRSLGYV